MWSERPCLELAYHNAAEKIGELAVPPGNKLEKLKGDLAGQYSAFLSMINFGSASNGPALAPKTSTSSTITEEDGMPQVRDADDGSLHPGAILKEDFLDPPGVNQYRLAQAIGVPPRRINETVRGTRRISADTTLRLSRFFGMSDEFWMHLLGHYDVEVEMDKLRTTSQTLSRSPDAS